MPFLPSFWARLGQKSEKMQFWTQNEPKSLLFGKISHYCWIKKYQSRCWNIDNFAMCCQKIWKCDTRCRKIKKMVKKNNVLLKNHIIWSTLSKSKEMWHVLLIRKEMWHMLPINHKIDKKKLKIEIKCSVKIKSKNLTIKQTWKLHLKLYFKMNR